MPIEPNAGSSATPSTLRSQNSSNSTPTQHIWVVTGPAGCGKSTVGQALRKELGVPFLEGDDVWKHCLATSHEPISYVEEECETIANTD